MPEKHKFWTIAFGLIEICIGLVTLIAVISSLVMGKSAKTLEILIFVLSASVISLSLGLGILRHSLQSYHLLLFFATVIIFSKFLILARVIILNGALETGIHPAIKNLISIFYHLLLIIYFIQPSTRKEFGEKRNVLFSLKLPFLR